MSTLSLPDAAQLAGCSPSDLLRHIKSGKLAATRSGGDGRVELRVGRADLVRSGLLDPAAVQPVPAVDSTSTALSPVRHDELTRRLEEGDFVPGLLYRELLMKHEQLLVQYGMVRVGGARLFEYKAEAEQTRSELDGARRQLRDFEESSHEEVADLQARLRRAELRLQERDEELRVLRSKLRTMELAARNATATESVERRFLDVMDKERAVEGLRGDGEPGPRRTKRFPSDH